MIRFFGLVLSRDYLNCCRTPHSWRKIACEEVEGGDSSSISLYARYVAPEVAGLSLFSTIIVDQSVTSQEFGVSEALSLSLYQSTSLNCGNFVVVMRVQEHLLFDQRFQLKAVEARLFWGWNDIEWSQETADTAMRTGQHQVSRNSFPSSLDIKMVDILNQTFLHVNLLYP